jgi:hypothetical protein
MSNWQQAREQNTPLWQACIRAARQNLQTARFVGAQFNQPQDLEEAGFASVIYQEVCQAIALPTVYT